MFFFPHQSHKFIFLIICLLFLIDNLNWFLNKHTYLTGVRLFVDKRNFLLIVDFIKMGHKFYLLFTPIRYKITTDGLKILHCFNILWSCEWILMKTILYKSNTLKAKICLNKSPNWSEIAGKISAVKKWKWITLKVEN